MVISFLEGSDVMEEGVELRINKQLRKIIRDAQNIRMYFYCTSAFMTSCEWEVRKLRAAYPEKSIEVFRIMESDDLLKYIPAVRYMGHIIPCRDEVDSSGGLLKWLVDQSDYILCYMDPLMSHSRERETAFRYACLKLGERCINLCTNEAKIQVRAQISRLPKWERRAMEGRLTGEKKKAVAADLGVTVATVRNYEISGQRNAISKIYVPRPEKRYCAVFGFSMKSFTKEYKEVLIETIWYLIHSCGISFFIIPEEQQRISLALTGLLSATIRHSTVPVKLGRMKAVDKIKHVWGSQDNGIFYYEQSSKGYVTHILEERKAMIDIGNIVLCDIGIIKGSGLSYAGKKHVPVINLADVAKEKKASL